jgi:tetratricopeptide (TPR) repeat protein
VWAAAALALFAGTSLGQLRDPTSARPLLLRASAGPPVSQRPVPALTPDQYGRLEQARAFRQNRLHDRARGVLEPLLREVPHHALVLGESARLLLARGDAAGVDRLARTERAATRDSLLLGREAIEALETLDRAREATRVAVEMWLAAPDESDWAQATITRLLAADAKGVVDAVRRVAAARPDRTDLARGLARLEWRAGDPVAARRTLAALDRVAPRPPSRWGFAEELLRTQAPADSVIAADVLVDLAGETAVDAAYRLTAARRALEVMTARGREIEGVPALARALGDIGADRWPTELLVSVVRGLRRAGLTREARALIEPLGEARPRGPELELERALTDLRDGPPGRALPALEVLAVNSTEAAFRLAEALFFDGRTDSALAWYGRVSSDPASPFAGPALERLYLIEDANPPAVVPAFGRLAYEEWRGERRFAARLADSLVRALPRGPMWAHAAIALAVQRVALDEPRAALEPLLALADSLPEDRLAPLARQRAGDIYLDQLRDDVRATAQYEECLARYPRAWNAPEVRRRLEQLRKRGI